MMRRAISIVAILFSLLLVGQSAFAMKQPNIEVNILSPQEVKDYPGKEATITAEVTNHSKESIKNLIVYITMADMGKKWTVNLEDYSADKPVQIKELNAGETRKISLPIRFVYTSNYHLYVTAASEEELDIYSSNSIPVNVLGNTKMDPMIVQIVSILTPVVLLVIVLWKFNRYRRRIVT